MKVTITSLKLKSAWKFFALSRYALDITKQMKRTNCRAFKKQGVWTQHYTMTLWDSEEDLKDFAHSGAHREAMAKSGAIASEIGILTISADALPPWKEAKKLLREQGKVIRFGDAPGR